MKVYFIDIKNYSVFKSIKILRRTLGNINSLSLDGSVLYNIQYFAEVCYPLEGTELNVEVISKNKLGLLCKKHPLSIVIPKQSHSDIVIKQLIEDCEKGDKIDIKIIGSRFKKDSKEIFVIGEFIKKNNNLIK